MTTALLSSLSLFLATGTAADRPAEVEAAIQRGAGYLSTMPTPPEESEAGLLAYTLLACGKGASDPAVSTAINKILTKCAETEYRGKSHHLYEAGVDAMALASADKEKYRPQLETIAKYIISQQREHGAWDYPNQNNLGDTSITQYAMLGLWAASRAGIQIPVKVWDQSALWHFKSQKQDGSFAYHPYGGDNGPKHSMAVAGLGSLSIARIYLSDGALPVAEPEEDGSGKPKKPEKAFGVLEKAAPMEVADTQSPDKPKAPDDANYKPTATKKTLDSHIAGALGWLGKNFTVDRPGNNSWPKYYLYGMERAAALNRVDRIGGRDWYKDGCQHLLATQTSKGHWTNEPGGDMATTCFAVLFLCRATDKIAPNPPPPPKKGPPTFGGGLLAGGRGLPTDLSAVETKDNQIVAKKLDTPLDKLLADLESPQAKNLEATQSSIVQAVQVGDRATLIGKKDLLLKLRKDPRVDVRRTAYWALGRCNDLRLSPILIEGLNDLDYDVAVEARNALCILSRRPRGFGLPDDLIAKLPESLSQVEKDTAFEKWRRDDYQKWKDWYRSVRPYEERDKLTD